MSFAPFAATGLRDEPPASGGTHTIAGGLEGDHILAPLLTPEVPAVTDQIEVATTLARTTNGTLHVTNPITVPEQTPIGLRHRLTDDEDTELLNWALGQAAESTNHVEGSLLYSRRLVKGVLSTIATNDVDTVVLPGRSPGDFLRGGVTERIATHADCDVIVVNGRPGYDSVPSILLPIAGGPHSGLAADVAQRIAEDCDAWIDVLHVVEDDASNAERDRAAEYVDAAYQRIARPEVTATWILEAADPTEAIIEQSRYYDLTVLGAPTKGRLRRLIYGSTNKSVRSNAESVVLSARDNNGARPLSETD